MTIDKLHKNSLILIRGGGYNQQESGEKVKNWNELPARKKAADPVKAGAALFTALQLRVCWNKESEEFL